MNYRIHQLKDTYVIVDIDQHCLTPGGKPLKSKNERLIQVAIDDLNRYGPDPTEALSTYSMLCSYIDFAQEQEKKELFKPIHSDIENDRAFDLPADPELYTFLMRCYENELYNKWDIRSGLHSYSNEKLTPLVLDELLKLSKRQIMTAIIFVAHFHSTTLALALVGDHIDQQNLAQGMCPKLLEHIVNQFADIVIGQSKYEALFPQKNDIEYCEKVCCTDHFSKYPKHVDQRCAIYGLVESLYKFSQYPDE